MDSTTEAAASSMPDPTALFEQVHQYPWDTDDEFQSGLAAILGSDSSPDRVAELTIQARCFYYSRKYDTHIDFEAFKEWKQQKEKKEQSGKEAAAGAAIRVGAEAQSASASEPEPGPKFSYQEIVEMIQTGKPIPGIKEIPDTVLEGQGTTSTTSRRKKPWEKDEAPPATSAPEPTADNSIPPS